MRACTGAASSLAAIPLMTQTPRAPHGGIMSGGAACKRRFCALWVAGLGSLAVAAAVCGGLAAGTGSPVPMQPRGWHFMLAVEDQAPRTFGPFADLEACNLRLSTEVTDLDARLPGLFVAQPCQDSAS